MCQLKPTGSMYYVTTVPVALEVALSLSIHFLVLVCVFEAVSVHGNYKLLRNRMLHQSATYETKYRIRQIVLKTTRTDINSRTLQAAGFSQLKVNKKQKQ